MNKYPLLTHRLWEAHKSPAEMAAVLNLLRRQRAACDEVWFATEYGFPSLQSVATIAAQMATAAAQVRAAGIIASLQISNTIGHGEYLSYLDFSGITWQKMIGPDGAATPCSNCPRDPAFLAYFDAATRLYCAWQPDSVWIDDDLRMQNHGRVRYGCFCPQCIAAFNAATGFNHTRASLATALNAPGGARERQTWINFGRDSLAGVARCIALAVKAVAPECRLGLQQGAPCYGGYNGSNQHHVFEVLQEVSGRAPGYRPGGGFYDDHAPREMLSKHLFSALQIEVLPESVDDIRVEIENLPGTVSGKSARGTALECTLSLAFGCNGLTLTPLMFLHEELAWHERMLSELGAWRPFWERYLAANAHTTPSGVAVIFSQRFLERPVAEGEPPFSWSSVYLGNVTNLLPCGMPLCWQSGTAAVSLPHPNVAAALTDEEVRTWASRNVITDGETMRRLLARPGVGDLFALDIAPAPEDGAYERFTTSSLNGHYAGSYIGLTALSRAFQPMVPQPRAAHEVLTHYEAINGTACGTATVAFVTPDGGRWVIFGNGCWTPLVTTARRYQLLQAADWASGGKLPAILETPAQVTVIPRSDANGKLHSVLLLNCSLDETPPMSMRLRHPAGTTLQWLTTDNKTIPLHPATSSDSDELLVRLPALAAWGVGVITTSKGDTP